MVNKCCFCIDLHVGIIAISSVWLLGNAIVLVWTSHLALVFNAALNDLESGVSLDAQAGVSFVMLTGAFWMAVVAAVLSGLAILLSIVLLAGAITARRKLLRGWMLAYAVLYGVVLVIGGLSVAAVFAFDYIVTGPCLALGLLLLVGLLVYFWIVVRSYYLELGQEYGEDGLRSIAEKV